MIYNDLSAPPTGGRVIVSLSGRSPDYEEALCRELAKTCHVFKTTTKAEDLPESVFKDFDSVVDTATACFRGDVADTMCTFTGLPTKPIDAGGVCGYYNVCEESGVIVLADRQFLNKSVYDEGYGDKLGTALHPVYGLYAGHMIGEHLPKTGSFLEIGFSNCAILAGLSRRGWKVTGLDMSCSSARLKQIKDMGGSFIKGDVATASLGKHDVIWLSHVLEHVNAPIAVVDRLYAALNPGGLLFISCPDPSYWFRGNYEPVIAHMHPDQHIWLGPSKYVRERLESLGAEVLKDTTDRFEDVPSLHRWEWRLLIRKAGG